MNPVRPSAGNRSMSGHATLVDVGLLAVLRDVEARGLVRDRRATASTRPMSFSSTKLMTPL